MKFYIFFYKKLFLYIYLNIESFRFYEYQLCAILCKSALGTKFWPREVTNVSNASCSRLVWQLLWSLYLATYPSCELEGDNPVCVQASPCLAIYDAKNRVINGWWIALSWRPTLCTVFIAPKGKKQRILGDNLMTIWWCFDVTAFLSWQFSPRYS